MSALYLETSALLRVFFDPARSQALADRIRGADRVVSSRLTQVEAERAVIRLCLDSPEIERARADIERDLLRLWARMDFIEMDAEVCRSAGQICPNSRLRTLDAVHLATFRSLRRRTPSLEMLTCDERILREIANAGEH